MDILGDGAATLINHGHPRSEVGKYSIRLMTFLLKNLAETKYGAKQEQERPHTYPVDERAKGIRVQRPGG